MNYLKPYNEQYHVFTNNFDDYTGDRKVAFDIVQSLIADGYENIRVYKDTEWNDKEGIFEDGDCIYSRGDFPS